MLIESRPGTTALARKPAIAPITSSHSRNPIITAPPVRRPAESAAAAPGTRPDVVPAPYPCPAPERGPYQATSRLPSCRQDLAGAARVPYAPAGHGPPPGSGDCHVPL